MKLLLRYLFLASGFIFFSNQAWTTDGGNFLEDFKQVVEESSYRVVSRRKLTDDHLHFVKHKDAKNRPAPTVQSLFDLDQALSLTMNGKPFSFADPDHRRAIFQYINPLADDRLQKKHLPAGFVKAMSPHFGEGFQEDKSLKEIAFLVCETLLRTPPSSPDKVDITSSLTMLHRTYLAGKLIEQGAVDDNLTGSAYKYADSNKLVVLEKFFQNVLEEKALNAYDRIEFIRRFCRFGSIRQDQAVLGMVVKVMKEMAVSNTDDPSLYASFLFRAHKITIEADSKSKTALKALSEDILAGRYPEAIKGKEKESGTIEYPKWLKQEAQQYLADLKSGTKHTKLTRKAISEEEDPVKRHVKTLELSLKQMRNRPGKSYKGVQNDMRQILDYFKGNFEERVAEKPALYDFVRICFVQAAFYEFSAVSEKVQSVAEILADVQHKFIGFATRPIKEGEQEYNARTSEMKLRLLDAYCRMMKTERTWKLYAFPEPWKAIWKPFKDSGKAWAEELASVYKDPRTHLGKVYAGVRKYYELTPLPKPKKVKRTSSSERKKKPVTRTTQRTTQPRKRSSRSSLSMSGSGSEKGKRTTSSSSLSNSKSDNDKEEKPVSTLPAGKQDAGDGLVDSSSGNDKKKSKGKRGKKNKKGKKKTR